MHPTCGDPLNQLIKTNVLTGELRTGELFTGAQVRLLEFPKYISSSNSVPFNFTGGGGEQLQQMKVQEHWQIGKRWFSPAEAAATWSSASSMQPQWMLMASCKELGTI